MGSAISQFGLLMLCNCIHIPIYIYVEYIYTAVWAKVVVSDRSSFFVASLHAHAHSKPRSMSQQ